MSKHSSILAEGGRRVWRRQRIVWWLFGVNLILGLGSAMPLSHRIGDVTNHSLAAQRLVSSFDYGTYSELLTTPDVNFGARFPESTLAVLVFFVFMVFVTGGILASYANEYGLSTREFFANSGAFFWRVVRLLFFTAIVLTPVVAGGDALVRWSGKLVNDAAGEQTGYWAGLLVVLLTIAVMIVVRIWFDLAQVHAVLEDERAMRRSCAQAFKLLRSKFAPLFWLYFRISILACLGLAVGLAAWTRLSGNAAMIVLELVLLWWIAARLWQRASAVAWYQHSIISARQVPVPEPAFASMPESLPMAAPPNIIPPYE